MIAALRLLALPPLELLDLKALDLRYLVRGPIAAGGETVIVGVDEASLTELGRWPWPRARLAALVEGLARAEVAVVGFDMVFDQRDALDDDARFAAAVRDAGRVVLGCFFEFGGTPAPGLGAEVARVPEPSVRSLGGVELARVHGLRAATRAHVSLPLLTAAAAGGGHFNFIPDGDGQFRHAPVAIRVEDRLVSLLAVEMVRRFAGVSLLVTVASDGVRSARLGPIELPVDPSGQLWLNHLGPARTIPHVSAADVVAGRVPREALGGKIALVGFTAAGFDEKTTPFAAVMPGVELQATMIDDLLHDRNLRRPWWIVPAEAGITLVVGLLAGAGLVWLPAAGSVLAAASLALGYAWATQRLFVDGGLPLSVLYPLSAIVLCLLGSAVFRAASEEREKQKIRAAFRQYLNPEVTDLIAREPGRLRLGGERRDVTVLFCDVRNFTSIAEGLDAEVLGTLLSEHLGALTDVIFRHQGLVDKYMGDAVMAFWGAPIDAPDHAVRCARAALEILEVVAAQGAARRRTGLPAFEVAVGVNSGQAAVGNFGSPQRFSYTAVGDGVNLASRLEGLNRMYGTQVIVSEATHAEIGDEFVCREIDAVRVKGRTQAVAMYELLGRRADDVDGTLARRAAVFAVPLAAHRRRAWDEAVDLLEAATRQFPHDTALAAFLVRSRALATSPPGPEWEAVSAWATK